MVEVALSTISELERDAMAGLLQLQGQSVQNIDLEPGPQVQPIPMPDDENMQTVTAAWVLTHGFSTNTTISSYESIPTQHISVTEASGDNNSSDSNKSRRHKNAQKNIKSVNRNRKFHFQLQSHVSGCPCDCFTFSCPIIDCTRCRWNDIRDEASQTDSSSDSSTSVLSDVSSGDEDALRLQQFVCEAMKRKTKVSMPERSSGPVAETSKQSTKKAVQTNAKTSMDKKVKIPIRNSTKKSIHTEASTSMFNNVTKTMNTKTKIPSRKLQLVKPSKYNQLPEKFDAESLVGSDEDWHPEELSKSTRQQRRRHNTSGSNKENVDFSELSELDETIEDQPKTKSDQDVVPIGEGNAKIPARLLKHMNWTSYTNVTRKLLTAVFPRSVLATHSLTGKPSPAFPNKPAKKKLDAALVNDIVQTVVERCGVPENVVRTSITTKCADESKMFRTRQRNKKLKNA